MLDTISKYWHFGTTYCAIEATTVAGSDTFLATMAKRKNNEFDGFRHVSAEDWTELAGKLPRKQHARLVLTVDQVITKTTELEQDEIKALMSNFPGIQTEVFYYGFLHGTNQTFVSICRRDVVERYVQEASAAGILIVGIHLGFGTIQPLLESTQDEIINTACYSLSIENGKVANFMKQWTTENQIKVAEQAFASSFILSIAGLLGYFAPEGTGNLPRYNRELLKRHTGRVFFDKGKMVGAIVLFCLFLVNFLVYTHLSGEYNRLSDRLEVSSVERKNIEKNAAILDGKEKTVQNLLAVSHSKSSLYINQVVSLAPSSIVFSEITFQPLEKSIRPDKQIEVRENLLRIGAETSNKALYSIWIGEIEALEWVETVTVTRYSAMDSDRDVFSLDIKISDDGPTN